MTRLRPSRPVLLLPAVLLAASTVTAEVTVSGRRAAWHPITLTLTGPDTSETATPNPFFDVRLVVRVEGGDAPYEVPGYYAADGNAAETGGTSGNVWRARFVPGIPLQLPFYFLGLLSCTIQVS